MRAIRKLGPVLALLFILTLFFVFQLLESQATVPKPSSDVEVGGSILVLFSAPDDPSSSSLRGGPDAALAEAIHAAQYSVDMAIYKLDLWSLRDALLSAHQRGVAVRLVVESDYADEPEIEALVSRGIPVREDERDTLMHHKFTVIDGYEVWTGSMNYSVNGAYRHDNNLLRVRSLDVGSNYTREFEEMFLEQRFGGLSQPDTPNPECIVDGDRVEVYFSPDDGVVSHLVGLIDHADRKIDMLAFALTSDHLSEALLDALGRGVEIRIVVEEGQAANTGSEVNSLIAAGVNVRLDGNPNSMHHKVILIDDETVITGSYNFSRSAEEYNDENVVVVHSKDLAAKYLVEFKRIYDQAAKAGGREE